MAGKTASAADPAIRSIAHRLTAEQLALPVETALMSEAGNTSSRDVTGAVDPHPFPMRIVLMVVLVSVAVLDVVVISRAVLRIRVMRALSAAPLWVRERSSERPAASKAAPHMATGFRWLEPL